MKALIFEGNYQRADDPNAAAHVLKKVSGTYENGVFTTSEDAGSIPIRCTELDIIPMGDDE